MKRRLFNLLAGMSLLLCVATVVMWVRSYFKADWILVDCRKFGFHVLYIKNGWVEFPEIMRGNVGGRGMFYIADPFAYRISAPFWLLLALFGVTALHWLIQIRKLRITNAGRCPKCGYDVRATPDRCPECGTVPKLVRS